MAGRGGGAVMPSIFLKVAAHQNFLPRFNLMFAAWFSGGMEGNKGRTVGL